MKKLQNPPPESASPSSRNAAAIGGDEEIQNEVREYNRRYLSWDELIHRVPDQMRREHIWHLMKTH